MDPLSRSHHEGYSHNNMATAVGRMPVALLHRRKPQPQQAATQPFKLRPWKASLSKKYHTSLETQCSSLKYCITTQSYKSNLLLSTCNCHHTCSDSSGGISSSSISALFRSNAAAVIDGNVVVNRHFIPFRSPRGDKIATQEREHFAPGGHHGKSSHLHSRRSQPMGGFRHKQSLPWQWAATV